MSESPPAWLVDRLRAAGGSVRFGLYMEWVLHDPVHGAYGSGHLRVGPRGDFVTSPSLGSDFAALLAPQVAEWLDHLSLHTAGPLRLIEAGPGEGDLAADLVAALVSHCPHLCHRLELVLVEPNPGMASRQRQRLSDCRVPVRWCSFDDLAHAPLPGVMLAHEVLDALAVERVTWNGTQWCPQLVVLRDEPSGQPALRLEAGKPLEEATDAPLLNRLRHRNLLPPIQPLPAGWTTELHTSTQGWLGAAAAALSSGYLLVIDYALEAHRYDTPARCDGTLVAYRGQQMCADPLVEPGLWDLTAHLCLESLDRDARTAGWHPVAQCRQGQALLALGLAQRLHALQQLPSHQLHAALLAREALLRLVDPACLGDFRWIAYSRGSDLATTLPLFMAEPSAPG